MMSQFAVIQGYVCVVDERWDFWWGFWRPLQKVAP